MPFWDFPPPQVSVPCFQHPAIQIRREEDDVSPLPLFLLHCSIAPLSDCLFHGGRPLPLGGCFLPHLLKLRQEWGKEVGRGISGKCGRGGRIVVWLAEEYGGGAERATNEQCPSVFSFLKERMWGRARLFKKLPLHINCCSPTTPRPTINTRSGHWID